MKQNKNTYRPVRTTTTDTKLRYRIEEAIFPWLLCFAAIFMVGLPAVELMGAACRTAISAVGAAFAQMSEEASAVNYVVRWFEYNEPVQLMHRAIESAMITMVVIPCWRSKAIRENVKSKKLAVRFVIFGGVAISGVLSVVSWIATVIQYAACASLVKCFSSFGGALEILEMTFTGTLPVTPIGWFERLLAGNLLAVAFYLIKSAIDSCSKSTSAKTEDVENEYRAFANKTNAQRKSTYSNQDKIIPFPVKKGA